VGSTCHELRRGTRSTSWPPAGSALLKDRVLDVDDFLDALSRIAAGGSALDPEVVGRLLTPRAHDSALALLTLREREVLALMAEGRTNRGIAQREGCQYSVSSCCGEVVLM
jgi:DNA-binding NarL/FixJ family response regulator